MKNSPPFYRLTVINCIMQTNMEEFEKLARILKELRESYKYTQTYVAKQLGITHQSYQAYEWGKTVPTLENYIKLANLYDVSLDYLIGKSDS